MGTVDTCGDARRVELAPYLSELRHNGMRAYEPLGGYLTRCKPASDRRQYL
jgi:hypothetical protein